MKFIDAVSQVMNRRMAADPRIVVMGEDVHRLSGGTNGATKGLKDAYPDRVLGTPISENAFTGLGGGMAMDGRFRPVVEFMYADFMWVAADQLFNQIGKARHMFGGTGAVPLVLRSKVAMGTGYGSQHSMDPAGIFATSAGWRIVAPSTPYDYVGLMNTALACDDPVLVLEHVDLYASTGPGLPDDLDHYLPVGRAAVRRQGAALTVLTYGAMTQPVLEAVAQTGVDAEVIDLRWLDRASLDWDTITASVQKTNLVLIAEQGAVGTSYGGWLGDEVARRLFDWLDAPVERLHGGEASPSISKVLERAAFARTEEAVATLEQIAADQGGGLRCSRCCGCPRSPRTPPRRCWPPGWSSSTRPTPPATPLVTVETEKAAVDIEAEAAGVLLRVLVPEGQQVEVGTPIAIWGDTETCPRRSTTCSPRWASPGRADPEPAPTRVRPRVRRRRGRCPRRGPAAPGNRAVFTSPLARRIAAEAGVRARRHPGHRSRAAGSVAATSRRTSPPRAGATPAAEPVRWSRPRPAAPTPGRGRGHTDVPASPDAAGDRPAAHREQADDAPLLHARDAPGSTGCSRCAARSTRAAGEVKVSVNDLVVKAVARAHTLVPALNVQWTGDAVRRFSAVDVAVAVATPEGLVTPVMRDVDAATVDPGRRARP